MNQYNAFKLSMNKHQAMAISISDNLYKVLTNSRNKK